MTLSNVEIWMTIIALGIGTFFLRYSFLSFLGKKELPEWVLRHLRYTPVAVLPGLIAPLVIWPEATQGETDPARLAAAMVTLGVGMWTRSGFFAITAGAVTLFAGLYLQG